MAILLTTVNAGSSYDYIDIYYTATASGSYHAVQVYANYRKTAGSASISAKSDCYINVNGTRACTGQKAASGSGTFSNILGPNTVNVSHGAAVTIPIAYNVYLLNGSYSGVYKSGSVNITLGALTSACGAPTGISITSSGGIVVPGTNVTVSANSGSAGVNNTPNAVRFFYKYSTNGASPTTISYDGYKDITVSGAGKSASWTYSVPAAQRGNYVRFCAQTLGSAGSSYYSGLTGAVGNKVNSLPNKPTISGVDSTIGPSATAPSFKITSAGDTDSQTVTLYYNWTNSISGATSITSGGSVSIDPAVGNSKTLYVWAKDSLNEYSAVNTRTVTRKTTSSITSWNTSQTINSLCYQGEHPTLSTFSVNSITCSITYNNFLVNIKYADNINFTNATIMATGGTTVNLNTLNIPAGNYYQFGISIFDKEGIELDNTWISENIYIAPHTGIGTDAIVVSFDRPVTAEEMPTATIQISSYTEGMYYVADSALGLYLTTLDGIKGRYALIYEQNSSGERVVHPGLDTQSFIVSFCALKGQQVAIGPVITDNNGVLRSQLPTTWYTVG